MAFVEAVAREFFQQIKNVVRLFFVDVIQLFAARDEFLPLLRHLVLVLFAHRAPQQIGAAKRVTRKHARRGHHLLLVNHQPVRVRADVGQKRMRVFDFRLPLFALDVIGNQIHRPRTVKRVQRDNVVNGLEVELPAPVHHPAVELEQANDFRAIEQFIHRRIVERDFVDVEIGSFLTNQNLRVADHRQRFQSEKIHLQHAEIGQRLH